MYDDGGKGQAWFDEQGTDPDHGIVRYYET